MYARFADRNDDPISPRVPGNYSVQSPFGLPKGNISRARYAYCWPTPLPRLTNHASELLPACGNGHPGRNLLHHCGRRGRGDDQEPACRFESHLSRVDDEERVFSLSSLKSLKSAFGKKWTKVTEALKKKITTPSEAYRKKVEKKMLRDENNFIRR
ncbi:hypothetical protein PHYSODRAFT_305142 [Phytophthora sojae]|uniref:Uncharacterized protein n=1 Tax=Phytophthora sojae (strain P6497) TaxID=1094619 RepID=G5A4W1_PHYSP|nr:hypothetical protein PHYSODRAFT_305142 [Phytophthora sojae]EGZ09710.1 hypothetical protein PHYSODRAFT_305142 [Phytophthora sojae]|eukprot:XP_009534571.1 hypothetical protein PHYSODRAFT_305142 [Phytophthora sojae]